MVAWLVAWLLLVTAGHALIEAAYHRQLPVERLNRLVTGQAQQFGKTFLAVCRCRGVTPVLMTQQNRLTPAPDAVIARVGEKLERDFHVRYEVYRDLYASMNEVVRAVASRNRVLLVDLDRSVPKSPEFIYDAAHLNDRGSLLAARLIADALAGLPALRTAAPGGAPASP